MTRGRVHPRLLAAAFAAAAFAGCGGPAPSSPPASTSPGVALIGDVCAVAPELPEIVGRETLAPPGSFAIGPVQRCLWTFGANPSRYVGVTVGGPRTHTETIRVLGPGEPVEGLGDEARWWPATATLSVLVGQRAFQVDLQLDEDDGTSELATRIGLYVLGQLP